MFNINKISEEYIIWIFTDFRKNQFKSIKSKKWILQFAFSMNNF